MGFLRWALLEMGHQGRETKLRGKFLQLPAGGLGCWGWISAPAWNRSLGVLEGLGCEMRERHPRSHKKSSSE